MALVTHFCGVCGLRVPPDDLEAQRALILENATYCHDCASKAGIKRGRTQSPVAVTTAPSRRGATHAAQTRRTTARAPTRSRQRSGSGIAIVVGGGLALLALALVVVSGALDGNKTADTGGEKAGIEAPVPGPTARISDQRATTEQAIRERVRNKAREALSRMTKTIPGSGASLVDLIGAGEVLARRGQELRLIVASAPKDPALDSIVARSERLAKELAARVEGEAERLFLRRMEGVEAFISTGNFDRALKKLADLPEGFEQTSWAKRLRKEVARVEAAKVNSVRAEAMRLDPGWTYLFTATSLSGWTGQGSADLQLAKDGEIGYRYLVARNPGPRDARFVFAAAGGEAWRDFKLRLDLRSVDGDLLILVGKPGTEDAVFQIRVASKSVPQTDGWWTLQIEADGSMVRLLAGARLMGRIPNPAGATGRIGFGLKAKSHVDIRNVRVKIVR